MAAKKNGCFTRLLLLANIAWVLCTLLSFFSDNIHPQVFWPSLFVGMIFPILFFGNVLFLLFWIFRKKWFFLLSFACLLFTWQGVNLFYGHPFKKMETGKEGSFTVLSFNIHASGLVSKKRAPELKEFIQELDPEILCFQEYNSQVKKKISFQNYPYSSFKPSQAIFSKYPIEQEGIIKMDQGQNVSNGAHWADININGRTIRVYNLHLYSNRISGMMEDLVQDSELEDIRDKETWSETRTMLAMVKYSSMVRAKQARAVNRHALASPHPVIISGDFNDTPHTYTYRTLAEGRKDAFVEKGKGFGFTYRMIIPFLKIDFIISDPEIKVLSSKIISSDLSDHKPILSTFVLPPN